jgi:hypothetical protein
MASLVLVIESCTAHYVSRSDAHARVAQSWQFAARFAVCRRVESEILCFGDSLTKLGLLPRVLEARAGISASNLAVLGGQAPSSFILLRRVLEAGHRPRAILVGFSAPMLAMPLSNNAACWALLADLRDFIDLAWRSCDPKLVLAIATRWLCPSWRAREQVRADVINVLYPGARATDPGDDRRVFERNWVFNRGAQVAPRGFVSVEGAQLEPPSPGSRDWKPHRTNVLYVERFLQLAESHGVPVFWVLAPATTAWREKHRKSGVIDAYQALARRCLARFPGLTVLDGLSLSWDEGAFRDPIHVNRDGAVALSIAVGDAVSAHLGTAEEQPRWISLAAAPSAGLSQAFRDDIEDIEQSRLAVGRIVWAGEQEAARTATMR